MLETTLDKFLRYVKIDTQSNENSETTPSTEKQFDLSRLLLKELQAMGIEASLDEHCYVYANIPANIPANHPAYKKVPAVGFIAHVDTSPDVSGANVKPQIIEKYQGGDLVLPGDKSVVIKENENPGLKLCYGHKLVTTDGTTLLGADDKAGVAAIMSLAQILINDNSLIHGDIKIAFTPDEEIGQGTKFFDIKKFGADYAFTVDGELPGELNKETFSADAAVITVLGRDIHPGSAKDIMINALRVLSDIIAKMPKKMAPETTDKYEPYIHPHTVEGSVSKATVKILLRDFDSKGLVKQKEILEDIIKEVQAMYPNAKIELKIIEQYRNMADELSKKPEVLDNLWEAATRSGAKPHWEPIRGGTDGSRLTEMGLPTPNIYGGAQNFHSKNEWLSVDFMNLTVKTLMELTNLVVEKAAK